VTLFDKLTNIGIRGTGTIRANRLMKCPHSDLAKSKRGAYDYAFDSSSHVVLVRWMHSKPVTLAFNCNGVLSMMKARRWSNATKSKVEIDQPFLVSYSTINTWVGLTGLTRNCTVPDPVKKVVLAYNRVLAADCHAQCLDILFRLRCICNTATFTFTVHS